METLAQYNERVKLTSNFTEPSHLLKEVEWANRLKGFKMFTVIDETEADAIIASARTRGAVKGFLNNLGEFYAEWSKEHSGAFMLWLNKDNTDPFYGKRTDSLYQSLNGNLAALDLKNDWRLIKRTIGEDSFLVIAHL